MKHLDLILTSALLLAGAHAQAFANSDPAAGGSQPAVPVKVAPKAATPVTAPAAKAVNSDPMAAPKAAARVEAVTAPAPATKAEIKKAKAAAAAAAEEKPQAAATPARGSLEEQLQSLDVGNKIPVAANREKLYAVQERNLPLRWKSEITIGGASNLTGDSYIRTYQAEAGYRLHINDRWSLGLHYASVDNKLKSEVDGIKTNNGALPVVPYAISRTDLTAEYNIFYGKFRWSAETVSYFDLYLALGAGNIEQNTGTTTGYVGDIGFAFWMGKWASTRIGLKDYYYKEEYRTGPLMTHNLHAHLDLGVLF